MVPERGEELLRRRAQLQERLRQRQAADILRGFTQPLDEAGVLYALAAGRPYGSRTAMSGAEG